MHRGRPPVLALPVLALVALTLVTGLLAGCGSSGEPAATSDTAPPGTAPPGTASPDTAPPDTASPDTASPGTAPPDTTPGSGVPVSEPVAEAPAPLDLATLPELVALVDPERPAAAPPLELAQQVGGFPLEIPVPDGSTLWDVVARFDTVEQGALESSFEYRAIGPDGAVPDIDINLDDNGPGSQQVIDLFDPIMAGLGFERTNSTASDPGDPGGPNSVNHVYVPINPVGEFNGVPGSIGNVFVWSDEDLTGGSYRGEAPLGGYRIDLDIDTVAVPSPLLATLVESFPTPPGAVLTDGEVHVQRRTPESFLADRGLAYLDITLVWEVPAEAFDDAVAFYSDGERFEAPWRAAEASFFNDGEWEAAEPYEYNGTDLRLDLLLLDRYTALLGVDAPTDGATTVITLDLDADTIAPVLAPPAG